MSAQYRLELSSEYMIDCRSYTLNLSSCEIKYIHLQGYLTYEEVVWGRGDQY